jgi:hypothetical protein
MSQKNNVKFLNIQLMFSDNTQLPRIFERIYFHVIKGIQDKTDTWNIDGEYMYYSFTQEFSITYDYKESHIEGNVCHVYKSKI